MKPRSRILSILVFLGTSWTSQVLISQAATSVHIPNRRPTTASQFAQVSLQFRTLMPSGSLAIDKTATHGLVSADKEVLTFQQQVVRVVVHTGPENDMLSFRINGLRNPVVVVPRGAVLKVLFVNNDGDMSHNIRFGAYDSHFPNDATSLLKTSAGTPPIPHAVGSTLHASELTVKAPTHPGKYAYFCTVRGHAQGGMHGTIEVR